MRLRHAALLVPLLAVLLAACAAPVQKPNAPRQIKIPPPSVSVSDVEPPRREIEEEPDLGPAPPDERDGPPDPDDIPPGLADLPDPVPEFKPPGTRGNPKNYVVRGKKYHVLASAEGYRETGLASWYGKKFHGRRTSSGERYDMFKLTAAHKHLPLPTYARVTNLGNGKSVIVRINDRGPFHDSRVIDLSYAAATRLDTVGKIAMVEIEAITPGKTLPPPPKLQIAPAEPGRATRLLQVGAFSDPVNAVALREELASVGIKEAHLRAGTLNNGDTVHRVTVGPFDDRQRMDEMRIRIRGAGFEAFPVTE